jgi:hypothetical protein
MPDIDDGGKVVTLKFPKCLQIHRVSSFSLPLPLVYEGVTSTGISSRQLISRVPRGSEINLELRWVSDETDEIAELYEFILEKALGSWNVFLLSESIKCHIPGFDALSKYLPSQLWKLELPNDLTGLVITPSNCCSVDLQLTLRNILLPPSDYAQNNIDFATMDSAVKNPTATTPIP